ncbi:hypothetical protein D081_2053 [Anaerovibrio sp. JC8]|uniref:hypothetical protein n=1 Tax=Anaerovibrio sp. JC8 TaxID=1240085 RepID=UPI000A0D0E17|nr:hypothetical protein [Anaerovibrio sp. JC8]ORT99324.1 hypothetical protein D081_2053 [Anaerovibrio sp. JC8]
MRKFLFAGMLAVFVSLLCLTSFSSSAEAKAHIRYHLDHVHLNSAGEAYIEGHFTNDGDTTGYVKWFDTDLSIVADNGQLMWADEGIRHYLDEEVPAYEIVHYDFIIYNEDIPEYHGRYTWKSHTNTHWEGGAG